MRIRGVVVFLTDRVVSSLAFLSEAFTLMEPPSTCLEAYGVNWGQWPHAV